MNIELYYNKSDKRVLNKTLERQNNVTGHFKENSSIIDPVIILSTNVDIYKYNYVHIPKFNRYYFIQGVEVSQQRYIVTCKSDVLMSFKDAILKQNAQVIRNATRYNVKLEDDRQKLLQYSHYDTYSFQEGEHFEPSVQEFLLTVVGNTSKNANISHSKNNDGGAQRPQDSTTPQDYEELPQDQKDDGTQYIIYNGSVGSLPEPSEVTNYWILTPGKYASLSQSTQEDGTTYYISNVATNVKGTRVINTTEEGYENLALKEKRNNTPYYITNRRLV